MTSKTMTWWMGALLLMVVAFAQFAWTASHGQTEPPSTKAIASEFFGMHIHHADTTTPWPAVSFGSWRLWDAAVSWANLEPYPGHWDFSRLDRLVSLAQQHNVEIILTLGNTPRWASARPEEDCAYGRGCAAEPRDIADWKDYVRTVATRYKGRIRYYELWNEPAFRDYEGEIHHGFYTGTLAKMIELGQAAHQVIKEIDPDNKLLTPGFTGKGDRLDQFLGKGGKALVDIVSFHFYEPTPEIMYDRIGQVRQVMKKYGLGQMELWDTEQGYEVVGPDKPVPGPGGYAVRGMDTLAAYVPRSLILANLAGASRFFWYSWEWTLMAKDGTPNQAGMAYAQAVRWLKGAKIERCSFEIDGRWLCRLSRGSQRAWIVWAAAQPLNWDPPRDWGVTEYESIEGSTHRFAGAGSIEIGSAPILLKSDSSRWAAS